jgi:hypothetical protein
MYTHKTHKVCLSFTLSVAQRKIDNGKKKEEESFCDYNEIKTLTMRVYEGKARASEQAREGKVHNTSII